MTPWPLLTTETVTYYQYLSHMEPQFTGSQFPSGTTPGPQNSTPNFNRPAAFGS
ncbi:hypothetical protein Pst134EB_018364 [Puccinia striiformis f. sp. tritici]|nr:hypothetical protein Pst134EB_018364 [Puccinia striiformis f. sp. tritici]